jgi:hypothetical protein
VVGLSDKATVAPVRPDGDTIGIEIAAKVKQAIGLDDARSWVTVPEHRRMTECRSFTDSREGGRVRLWPSEVSVSVGSVMSLTSYRAALSPVNEKRTYNPIVNQEQGLDSR